MLGMMSLLQNVVGNTAAYTLIGMPCCDDWLSEFFPESTVPLTIEARILGWQGTGGQGCMRY